MHDKKNVDPQPTSPQPDLTISTRKFAMSLRSRDLIPDPLDDEDGIGCRKSKNIKKYYETTSGIIGLFRSCGIIIGIYEMFTKVLACLQVLILTKFSTILRNPRASFSFVALTNLDFPLLMKRLELSVQVDKC